MLRMMSIATLVLIALCFFVGAGLAFADEGRTDAIAPNNEVHINDASRPSQQTYEPNLAEREQDRYDFSDYLNGVATHPTIDAESIEDPDIKRGARLEV